MSKVVLLDCKTYEVESIMDKMDKGIELVGGWDKYVNQGSKVLLKVNLIGPKDSESGAVTHSEFVRALVRILKGKGCEVWIGDSSGGAIAGIAPTAGSMKKSGLEKVALEEGAVIKNFDAGGIVTVVPESGLVKEMHLAKPMFEADVVINLPKLKTHSAAIYTGAVKNVFGCIPGLKKADFHKLAPNPADFGEIIADIHKACKISLHIMDGITAMQGEGPTAGKTYQAGKMLISEDPLALDTVAAKMLKLTVEDVPILKTARKRGLGESELKNIKLMGDFDTVPVLTGFMLPKRFSSSKKQNYGAVIKVIDFLKSRPVIDKKLCKNCNTCVESCPVKAIDKATKVINYNACIECMCCHELCMYKAVKLKKDNWIAGAMMKLYRGNYR
ncbi:MAG: hypothetical protein K0R84_301 [Clostridia bacterium]|jgi:uncharacterized protein (DUF362 family)/NAD-dependent dihydropyrimidine dehydrogenase PreA subunit|nr:hypothetical protein [Clostridia bacterium]